MMMMMMMMNDDGVLCGAHGVMQLTEEQVHVLYKFAKAQYMCGNYSDAADYLFHYIPLASQCPDMYGFLPFSLPLRVCRGFSTLRVPCTRRAPRRVMLILHTGNSSFSALCGESFCPKF